MFLLSSTLAISLGRPLTYESTSNARAFWTQVQRLRSAKATAGLADALCTIRTVRAKWHSGCQEDICGACRSGCEAPRTTCVIREMVARCKRQESPTAEVERSGRLLTGHWRPRGEPTEKIVSSCDGENGMTGVACTHTPQPQPAVLASNI